MPPDENMDESTNEEAFDDEDAETQKIMDEVDANTPKSAAGGDKPPSWKDLGVGEDTEGTPFEIPGDPGDTASDGSAQETETQESDNRFAERIKAQPESEDPRDAQISELIRQNSEMLAMLQERGSTARAPQAEQARGEKPRFRRPPAGATEAEAAKIRNEGYEEYVEKRLNPWNEQETQQPAETQEQADGEPISYMYRDEYALTVRDTVQAMFTPGEWRQIVDSNTLDIDFLPSILHCAEQNPKETLQRIVGSAEISSELKALHQQGNYERMKNRINYESVEASKTPKGGKSAGTETRSTKRASKPVNQPRGKAAGQRKDPMDWTVAEHQDDLLREDEGSLGGLVE